MEGGTRLNVVKQDACIVQPIMIESTLQFDNKELSCTRPFPHFSGGSKVTYVVKKTERETAWEQSYPLPSWPVWENITLITLVSICHAFLGRIPYQSVLDRKHDSFLSHCFHFTAT